MWRRALKTMFMGVFWFCGGLIVIGYGAALVYANVARVETDSAMIMGTVESLQAPAAGYLQSMPLKPGFTFGVGDKLFTVHEPEVEQRIGLASVRVERAKSELVLKQGELTAERGRRDDYIASTKAEVERLRAELRVQEELERSARSRLERTTQLFALGYTTGIRLEEAAEKFAETRYALERARIQLNERTEHLHAVVAGRAYGGVRGLGKLVDAEAAVVRAQEEVVLAAEELRVQMERRAEMTVYAASRGKVFRVLRLTGAAVQPGDAVAIVERDDDRMIYVFLTQSEVGRIAVGDEADIFLPAQRISARASVVTVERSGGYLDDVETRYLWRTARDPGLRHTDRDRTARVTLRFGKADQSRAQEELTPGTPAVVSFSRRWQPFTLAGLDHFASLIQR
jgi:multidrug resistance efflux pump